LGDAEDDAFLEFHSFQVKKLRSHATIRGSNEKKNSKIEITLIQNGFNLFKIETHTKK